MPKCLRCKEVLPKEAFYTANGYRCIECRDCRIERKELRAEAQVSPGTITRTCVVCGGTFEQTDRRPRKYCSLKCRREVFNKKRRDWRKDDVEAKRARVFTCSECKQPFTPVNATQATCSEQCQKARLKRLKEERQRGVSLALDHDPYADGGKWAGVDMNSTSFNPFL